ncbi:MarR family winged helix-turn-helix transcriptional regulator [Nocardia salmonicida]|uniref:MarR family winged helix-turn-helix transcriptional regulator n=1 Tax=Nocardia salmonicida TaxID=53431 RepID=UPI0007A50AB2|nr:MarR family transcriptional regulator [Nocardia salmonicida]
MTTSRRDDLPADVTRTTWTLHRALRQSQGSPRGENPRPLAQVEVLKLVDSRPGITIREISEELHMQANNVSTLVSNLVKDGFMERHTDPEDRRVVKLHPTPKMLAASTELADRLDAGVSDALATLSEKARARIAAALPDLRTLAEALSSQP